MDKTITTSWFVLPESWGLTHCLPILRNTILNWIPCLTIFLAGTEYYLLIWPLPRYPKKPWTRFVTAENERYISPEALDFLSKLLVFDHNVSALAVSILISSAGAGQCRASDAAPIL